MENQQGTSINFETFTWKIENFSKQNIMNLRSKAFRIRGYKWRIHLYPLRKDANHFSLYLMVADSLPPYGWSRNTYFKLVLINQLDGNKSIVKETHQKFNGGHRSWGSLFLNLSDFYDSKQGYLVNNTCIIEAHVCVSDVALNTKIQPDNLNKISPITDPKSVDQETESTDESETQTSTTCVSSQTEEEVQIQGSDLTLRDLLDLESLGADAAAYVPLLDEAFIWHPSLLRSQRKKPHQFRLWSFRSLGQVLYFLKTSKVKDMNEDACSYLHGLWEGLKSSGFDLAWLEPYVQSALGLKGHLEKNVAVKKLQDDVVEMEIKMKKLRGELAAAEAEFGVARKDLAEARKGFMEIDLNAELGYAMF